MCVRHSYFLCLCDLKYMSPHLCPLNSAELTAVEWGKAASILYFIHENFKQKRLTKLWTFKISSGMNFWVILDIIYYLKVCACVVLNSASGSA